MSGIQVNHNSHPNETDPVVVEVDPPPSTDNHADETVASLRDKIAELESVLRALPDLYFRLSIEGEILDYHAGTESNLYAPPSDFLNRRVQDIMPPDIARQFEQAREQLIQNNKTIACIHYTLTLAGVEKAFEARHTLLGQDQIVLIVRDITDAANAKSAIEQAHSDLEKRVAQRTAELSTINQKLEHEARDRRQTEKMLREKNAFLRLLQTVAVAANESVSVRETFSTVLKKICTHTGWPVGHVYLRDESAASMLVPSTIWHLGHPEQFKTFKAVTESTTFTTDIGLPGRVLATKKPAWIIDVNKDPNFPRRKLAKDLGVKAGFAFPVLVGDEVTAVLEFFSTETAEPDEILLEVMAYVGTQLGRVTERSQAEDSLRRSESRFRQLFKHAADALYLHDQEGRLINVNHKACEDLGYSRDELLQLKVWDIDASYTRDALMEMWQLVIEDPNRSFKIESTHRHKDGKLFTVEIQGVVIDSQDRHLFLACVRDITEQQDAEAAILRARDDLEHRVEQRTAQLSRTNTRLQRESAERQRLEKAVADRMTDEQRAMGQALHDGLAQQLTGTSMLAKTLCTKLKAGSSPLADAARELAELIKDAHNQVRSLINGLHPVEVDAEGLRAALENLTTSTEQLYGIRCIFEYEGSPRIDEANTATQVYYIAREAVNNAVRHADPTTIVIGISTEGGRSSLSVRDNGLGINDQSNPTNGMGLKIMNYRAGLIGATLSIQQAGTSGTLVTCTL